MKKDIHMKDLKTTEDTSSTPRQHTLEIFSDYV